MASDSTDVAKYTGMEEVENAKKVMYNEASAIEICSPKLNNDFVKALDILEGGTRESDCNGNRKIRSSCEESCCNAL